GVANLVVSEEDKERLSQMLRTLEERQKVAELLSAYLDSRQEAVRVVVGLEEQIPQMKNFVLIGAPARVGGEVRGSLAVIGPTRSASDDEANSRAAEASAPADGLGDPRDQVTRLQAERDALFDRLARQQAEVENFRKRAAKEQADFREYAVADTVKQLIPIL